MVMSNQYSLHRKNWKDTILDPDTLTIEVDEITHGKKYYI